jgi:hypothetical protein
MAQDKYGRTVSFSTDGTTDKYTVTRADQTQFFVEVPAGTPQAAAYAEIEMLNIGTIDNPIEGEG